MSDEQEIQAARQMRDAIIAYDRAENRGFTKAAILAWNLMQSAFEHYDAVRAVNKRKPQA